MSRETGRIYVLVGIPFMYVYAIRTDFETQSRET